MVASEATVEMASGDGVAEAVGYDVSAVDDDGDEDVAWMDDKTASDGVFIREPGLLFCDVCSGLDGAGVAESDEAESVT